MFLSLIPFLRLQHKISSLAIVAECDHRTLVECLKAFREK